MWKRKRDDELDGLRAELEAARESERDRAAAQRRADETGWQPDGRWVRPGRAARDRIARGES